jgi:hypothetical protein
MKWIPVHRNKMRKKIKAFCDEVDTGSSEQNALNEKI